jgi:hypothetical protein
MSVSNPSAASPAQPADLQQLLALLGSLMPLLLRFQSQTFLPQAFSSQAFPSQVFPPPFQFGPGFGNVPAADPALDHQAAVNLANDMISVTLRSLSTYLETNAGQHPGLDGCMPIVTQAAHSFAARDYARAFNLIWQAYRAIAAIRAADPRVPPLRAGEQASSGQASSGDPASLH